MARFNPLSVGPGGVVTMTNNPLMPHHAPMPAPVSPPAAMPHSGMSPPMSQVVHPPLPQSLQGNSQGLPTPAPAGLPGVIVRMGPAGGDAARTHLNAGHTPDALVEAAANSLAQIAMVGGRLDPARYSAWVQQRIQFLREIPNADALFGSVEAASHTIAALIGQNHTVAGGQPLQQQPGQPARPVASQNALLPMAISAATSRNPMPRR